MKNLLFFLLTLFPSLLLSTPPTVLISIIPHKFFIEKIAGATVQVQPMVPKGASSHTYEPTPKQILNASSADIWFQVGEYFEPKAGKALQHFSPNIELVDLRNNLNLIILSEKSHHGCLHHDCCDPHIWLSPKLAKEQAKKIEQTLSKHYPKNTLLYKKNLNLFLKELDQLDQELETTLRPIKNQRFFVSHPAYAYLARDYNLIQTAIECEGKDPSPLQVTELLQLAKKEQVKTVFIQPQHSSKGARLIAEQLNAKVVELDPYHEDYINNMKAIAEKLSKKQT